MSQLPPLRIVPGLLGAAILVVLCFGNGIRFMAEVPVLGVMLLGAGALWIAVYCVVSAQERDRLARLSFAGFAFYASIGLLSQFGAPAFADNKEMFSVLALEGIILFAIALIVSRIPFFWALAEKPG